MAEAERVLQDSERSLDDIWVYAIMESKWHIVPRHEDSVWPGPRLNWFDVGTGRVSTAVSDVSDDETGPTRTRSLGASAGELRPPTPRADFDVNLTRVKMLGFGCFFRLTQILRSFLAVRYHSRTKTLCLQAMSETETDSR